jgi:NADPH:quinone reductase
MRAWQVQRHGEPVDVLQLVDLEVPEPGPGEIRIRVGAAAVGLPDVLMCRGVYPLTPRLPFVAGQEVAGVVTAVGPDVDGTTGVTAVGSRVMAVTDFVHARGGFAEETIAFARSAFPVPDDMDDAEAAGFSIGFRTAWIGLVHRGALQPGEDLVVLGGAGGSGSTAISLGRALGAHVVAVAGGAEKGEHCRAMGAHIVVDHQAGSVAEAVRAITGGLGADVIYDPVGGDVADEAMQAIARDGRFLAVGFASGRWVQPDAHFLVRASASLVGVFAGGFTREFEDEVHGALLGLRAAQRLVALPATALPFAELPKAVALVGDRAVIGKVVVTA